MWWAEQNDGAKEEFKGLIQNGQVEFLNGAWAMEDEACPSYTDMIENF